MTNIFSNPTYANITKFMDESWIALRATKSRATWYFLKFDGCESAYRRVEVGLRDDKEHCEIFEPGFLILAMGLVGVLCAGSVWAADVNPSPIPFPENVKGAKSPSGRYEIRPKRLADEDGSDDVFIPVRTASWHFPICLN